MDEFPEQQPDEKTRLHCLQGTHVVSLPSIDLTGEDLTFPELAQNLVPEQFLKTQREKYEEARVRAMASLKGARQHKRVPLGPKAKRAKVRRKLVKQKVKRQLRELMQEIRARADEGYSMRQLMQSHIPDIGGEVKVSASEVTAALKSREAHQFWGSRGEIFSYWGGATIGDPNRA